MTTDRIGRVSAGTAMCSALGKRSEIEGDIFRIEVLDVGFAQCVAAEYAVAVAF
jgi:hypothetical protein